MKFLACLLGLHFATVSLFSQEPAIQLSKTAGDVEFGTWGNSAKKPAPVLVVLSGTIRGTLESAYFRQCGNELAERDGFLLISIDIPCHGTQTGEGKPSGLGGWATRAADGENIVDEFNVRLSEVVDHLIKEGIADPEKIAVCGTSRGGFLALHFLAHDLRVKCAAAFAPVTDLAALREFKGKENLPLTKAMNVAAKAEKLAGKPAWIVIGDQDERVSTASVIGCAQAITAASVAAELDSKVELRVMPEPRGHTTPKGSADDAAIWIREQIFGAETNAKTESTSTRQGSLP
ncbi:MAG: prolyl oligopeptidase family serine peptidase [Verrucomicrobiales bacterium]|nr:prolyl oligopeptidase family serine peptidase [Verrucomicrobiales bacterium]